MATTITIRHVPDEVRNELAIRAARSGRSLQEYMLGELTRLASKPSMDDLLAGVLERKLRNPTYVDADTIVAARDADRR